MPGGGDGNMVLEVSFGFFCSNGRLGKSITMLVLGC